MKTNPLIFKVVAGVFLISGILLFIQGYALITGGVQNTEVRHDGDMTEIQIRVIKNEWRFEPDEIVIPANSVARLSVFNEDSYAHSFAIKELGIDKRLPPERETVIELTNVKPGRYEFFCSVLCGKGHFEQKGVLIAR